MAIFELNTGHTVYIVLVALALLLVFYLLYRRMKHQQRRAVEWNIEQLALLRDLLADFQRHRGLSNGLLSGDQSMRDELSTTRQRLDKKAAQAERFVGGQVNAWRVLLGQWRQLSQIEGREIEINLQKHHRIIRETIFLIEDIATELDLSGGRDELRYLACIWDEVVQAAEWSGQARALGTGIAAAHQSSAVQRVRLRFLHQKIRELSSTAFVTLKQGFSGHDKLHQCEDAVESFLHCMEQELLNKEYPVIEAKHYFDQATRAVNELLALVDTALGDLYRVHGGR